jgi:hypothetical protein
MSIRLNLLPDLRQQKLRDKQRRNTATVVAIAICSAVGALTLILGLYYGSQKLSINHVTSKINDKENQLKANTELPDALTASQSLALISELSAKRDYYSKFLNATSTITPTAISFNSIKIDNTRGMVADGSSDSFATITKLAAALAAENVTLNVNTVDGGSPYFSNILITQVAKDQSGKVTFTITATLEAGVTDANK